MRVKVETPGLAVRCVQCGAIAPIEGLHQPGGKAEVDVACTCPSEQPLLEIIFSCPAANHMATIPLVPTIPGKLPF